MVLRLTPPEVRDYLANQSFITHFDLAKLLLKKFIIKTFSANKYFGGTGIDFIFGFCYDGDYKVIFLCLKIN